jgi:hypothetical protein
MCRGKGVRGLLVSRRQDVGVRAEGECRSPHGWDRVVAVFGRNAMMMNALAMSINGPSSWWPRSGRLLSLAVGSPSTTSSLAVEWSRSMADWGE